MSFNNGRKKQIKDYNRKIHTYSEKFFANNYPFCIFVYEALTKDLLDLERIFKAHLKDLL
jgi:hypothetical protein